MIYDAVDCATPYLIKGRRAFSLSRPRKLPCGEMKISSYAMDQTHEAMFDKNDPGTHSTKAEMSHRRLQNDVLLIGLSRNVRHRDV